MTHDNFEASTFQKGTHFSFWLKWVFFSSVYDVHVHVHVSARLIIFHGHTKQFLVKSITIERSNNMCLFFVIINLLLGKY